MRISAFLFVFVVLLDFSNTANASDKKFFSGITGTWQGPGEIVAGKYKGTKFVCTFDGDTLGKSTGMNIDGSCRVGLFAQPMNALIKKIGGRYKGKFLDGAKGEGMDVTGGRYSSGKKRLIVDVIRKDLRGVMIANLSRKNKLNITISVHVGKKLVPVIGMNLDRISAKPRPKTDKVVTSSVTATK